MSQFESFLENYNRGSYTGSSATGAGGHNGANIKRESFDEFLGNSSDIKKQLSQSFGGGGSGGLSGGGLGGSLGSGGIGGGGGSLGSMNTALHYGGGISKPHSRRNSAYIKPQETSDAEDNDDDDGAGGADAKDQGNERKRRDNINDKIQELLKLIPSEYFATTQKDEPSRNEPSPGEKSPSEEDINNTVSKTGTKDGKPNKGQILTKSVEYLQNLQNLIDENNRKEVELILKLESLKLKHKNGGQVQEGVPVRIGYTSAERALGEIGVGPCSEDYFKNILVRSANSSKSGRKNSS
ncbi:uncharacterized protein LODBEIA_P06290 [Lodderomyces beijingensis]|uniref:BHLH domain-containing protein n=1 Tax=Lodderomyces beijingensis TaxID=1775926 RepID=A0ABP0ZJ97_9ASCO